MAAAPRVAVAARVAIGALLRLAVAGEWTVAAVVSLAWTAGSWAVLAGLSMADLPRLSLAWWVVRRLRCSGAGWLRLTIWLLTVRRLLG